jgi:thymidylate synthase ThyX
MNELNIYLLKDMPPEIKAVTFAKCSRSPESFSDIAKELTEDKSREFHEKWVVGFGHSSVAEHAILSIAMENISILATKVIEDNRLASFTEKSTRYQIFNRDKYYIPENILNDLEYKNIYTETQNFLFDTYENLSEKMINFMSTKIKQEEGMGDTQYKAILKSKACDEIRFLLTPATLTNMGMTINARNLEHAITKMLSHPLLEIQNIGNTLKQIGQEEAPTLLKYANKNNYISETNKKLNIISQFVLQTPNVLEDTNVTIVDYDQNAEEKLIITLLYKHSTLSYNQIKEQVHNLSFEHKLKIINESLNQRGQYDQPLRELEHIYYTFDILIDYGAFRDIQRHRMVTQTNQRLTPNIGYSVPKLLIEAGFENEFKECIEKARLAYYKFYDKYPNEAEYLLPFAFKKRVLFT